IPAIKRTAPVMPYLHSHMLGVLEEYRDQGVGRMLKVAQRKEALARGFELIEWTFDPFQTKNAHFNLERLGAIVRRFVRNMYGQTTSPLHGGLRTDRCVAEWWIASERVANLIDRGGRSERKFEEKISVPAERTRESQEQLAVRFEESFHRGLTVTGFDRAGA